jgi:hypothetical protein
MTKLEEENEKLREEGLLIERKRSARSTTNSRHGLPTFENRTESGYTAPAAGAPPRTTPTSSGWRT